MSKELCMSHYDRQIEADYSARLEQVDRTMAQKKDLGGIVKEAEYYEGFNKRWPNYQIDDKEWCEYVKTTYNDSTAGATSVDMVNSPPHYRAHPSGIECIQITEHMNFCLGNAVKYLFRAGVKTEDAVQDLKKALWYINREIARLKGVEDV